MITKRNIFSKPENTKDVPEVFETIFKNRDILIERIITNGSLKTPGEWYDQEKDEWVILIQGSAIIEFKSGKIANLMKGDYILIPAHTKHRVNQTSENPNCIWLTIHGNLK